MDNFRPINNIPSPPQLGRGGREPKYKWEQMRIGQCIQLFSKKELNSARNAAYREKKRNPEFNYGAVDYGPNSKVKEKDSAGDEIDGGRTVYGLLWRMPPK